MHTRWPLKNKDCQGCKVAVGERVYPAQSSDLNTTEQPWADTELRPAYPTSVPDLTNAPFLYDKLLYLKTWFGVWQGRTGSHESLHNMFTCLSVLCDICGVRGLFCWGCYKCLLCVLGIFFVSVSLTLELALIQ